MANKHFKKFLKFFIDCRIVAVSFIIILIINTNIESNELITNKVGEIETFTSRYIDYCKGINDSEKKKMLYSYIDKPSLKFCEDWETVNKKIIEIKKTSKASKTSAFFSFLKDTNYIDSITKLFSWQITLLIVIAFLIFSKNAANRVTTLLSPLKSLKLHGMEFVLNKEEGQKIKRNLEETINTARDNVQRLYTERVYVEQIEDAFILTIDNFIADIGKKISLNLEKFRYTLYISDILFKDRICQLLDYYKGKGSSDKVLSIRFGIIGRAWRLGESQFNGNISEEKNALIKEWGMTRKEAVHTGLGRRTFICIMIKGSDKRVIGVMYADQLSTVDKIDEISNQEAIKKSFDCAAKKYGLVKKMEKLTDDLREYSLNIEEY